jgi:hypothetical protein
MTDTTAPDRLENFVNKVFDIVTLPQRLVQAFALNLLFNGSANPFGGGLRVPTEEEIKANEIKVVNGFWSFTGDLAEDDRLLEAGATEMIRAYREARYGETETDSLESLNDALRPLDFDVVAAALTDKISNGSYKDPATIAFFTDLGNVLAHKQSVALGNVAGRAYDAETKINPKFTWVDRYFKTSNRTLYVVNSVASAYHVFGLIEQLVDGSYKSNKYFRYNALNFMDGTNLSEFIRVIVKHSGV